MVCLIIFYKKWSVCLKCVMPLLHGETEDKKLKTEDICRQ